MTMPLFVHQRRLLAQFLIGTSTFVTMSRALFVSRQYNGLCRNCCSLNNQRLSPLNHRTWRSYSPLTTQLEVQTSARESSTRLFSSVALRKETQQYNDDDNDDMTSELLHPAHFLTAEGTFPPPKSLSPSSILEFQKCPQSFLLQYVFKLRQPTNQILCKGTMVHAALEKVFELDAPDRTLDNLQNLLRKEWSKERLGEQYGFLFEGDNGGRNIDAERKWGNEALQLLQNYYQLEDPRTIPKPEQREVWAVAALAKDASRGKTGKAGGNSSSHRTKKQTDTFLVRGIIDRLDLVRGKDDRNSYLRLTDYKTGKAPHLKYASWMNDKIRHESFYQLFIYALLMREKKKAGGVDLRFLRLFYMTSVTGQAEVLEYDLGATQDERDAKLQEIHGELSNVWADVTALIEAKGPEAAKLWKPCDRSFCYCHVCREKFVPGTLAEPETF